jgi:ElaB/YqjD/DUF883 family membrane-anchored ribosome-binding protein
MTTDSNQTLAHTRQLASQAMERAGSTVKDLRSGVHDAASRGISAMSERAAAAQLRLGEYAGVSKRYVAEHPLKSALIAAAVGAAVAGLVIALRHRRDSDKYF